MYICPWSLHYILQQASSSDTTSDSGNEPMPSRPSTSSGHRGHTRPGRGTATRRGRGTSTRRGRGGYARQAQKERASPFKWTPTTGMFQNSNTEKPFLETAGPTRRLDGLTEPIHYFLAFFTMNMVNDLVAQTNLYHDQKCPDNNDNFVPVCAEEIQAYIGVVIAMGLYKLPKIDDYWRTNGISHMPWFPSIFSRDRFRAVRRYFHLRDNTKRPEKDHKDYKLYQVYPLISCLTKTFGTLYVPSQNVSIDEMLLGTKCRVSFTQYMPKKPKRFGIKLWALCESKTGYCCDFQVYSGREDAARPELGLSYRVVFDLMKNYLDKGYRLFIDNFFTSVQLVYDLLQKATYVCGTLRSNRVNLPTQLTEKVGAGEAKFWNCDNLVVTHWKDKRDVFAMSSMHGNDSVEITNKRGDKKTTKPKMISDYNQNMGGVDLCDQLVSYYSVSKSLVSGLKD